jgi:hypothetical protein
VATVSDTVTIQIGGHPFRVPRGFGSEYERRLLRETPDPGLVRDALELIGYTAKLATIRRWSPFRRVEAMVYASNVHARASDNPVRHHPIPSWLPLPWLGPEMGRGAFRRAGPTEVTE